MTEPKQSMTRAERTDLIRLVKSRARLAKAETKQREAVLLSELLQELGAEYEMRDAMWADAVTIAEEAAAQANTVIVARCHDLGIPAKDAPSLTMAFVRRPWDRYGHGKDEMVTRAKAKLAALTETAKVMIDGQALEAETALLAGGLETEEARQLLEALPTVEQLMPPLTLDDVGVKHWQPPEGAASELMAPLTTTDRKRLRIRRAIEANPGASDRAIGQIAGVDHKTVAAARRAAGEFPTLGGESTDTEENHT